MSDTNDAVEISDRYMESESHVPDPTDLYATVDTSGTAGSADQNLRAATPIFDVAKQEAMIMAGRALDPSDPDVPSSQVVLPDDALDYDSAKERVQEAAKAAKENPVVVGSESLAGKAEAEESGEDGQKAAAASQAANAMQSDGGGNDPNAGSDGGSGDSGSGDDGDQEPAKTATRKEWDDYAVNVKGADRAEVEALPNKDAVQEQYGS